MFSDTVQSHELPVNVCLSPVSKNLSMKAIWEFFRFSDELKDFMLLSGFKLICRVLGQNKSLKNN